MAAETTTTTTKPEPKKAPSAEQLSLSYLEIVMSLTHRLPYSANTVPATLRNVKGKSTLTIEITDEQAERLQQANAEVLARRNRR